MTSRYRGRFAPSPTGALHFGSLLAALGSWLMARHRGGEWLIRIEDLDPPRTVPGAAESQLDTLAGFGLVSDGPVLWQSTRADAYAAALAALIASGDAFVCHCSRSVLDEGIHHACLPGMWRSDPAIRLRIPIGSTVVFEDAIQATVTQDVGAEAGDIVLRRTDGLWAYQLAVVVDDAAQGITDVVRGADLLLSTPRQILLQRHLGLPTPRYAHLPLVSDADGRKLSKSLAALPVDAADPMPALRMAWHALGQDPSATAPATAIDPWLARATSAFDPSRIPGLRSQSLAALHNGLAGNAE